MKEIKEKVRDQSSKIRNPASRLPKELVRSAMLEAKEKSSIMADKIGRETGEESPVEYAGNRIQRVEQRVGKESASAACRGGKKLAVKTYEKLKEQKQREAATAPLEGETGVGGTSAQAGQTMAKKGRTEATRSIKVKPETEKTIKEGWKSDGKNSAPCGESLSGFFPEGENPGSLTEKASTQIHESSQRSKTGCHALGSDCQAKCKDCKGNRKRIESHGRSRRSCSESLHLQH